MVKWFVIGNKETHKGYGLDVIGYVETVIEDKTDAMRKAQATYGAQNFSDVQRACHMERNSRGQLISVFEK